MINSTTASKPTRSTAFLLARTFLLMILGLVFGCLLYYAWVSGYFNFWHRLPDPPETAERAAGATIKTVDVEAASGKLYRLDWTQKNPVWIEVNDPLNKTDPGCELYAKRALPLSQIKSQVMACANYADAGETELYAVRSDGSVYFWRESSSAYEALLFIVALPAGGALLGLILGVVLLLVRR